MAMEHIGKTFSLPHMGLNTQIENQAHIAVCIKCDTYFISMQVNSLHTVTDHATIIGGSTILEHKIRSKDQDRLQCHS